MVMTRPQNSVPRLQLLALNELLTDGYKIARRRLNATQPIHRLPPELLASIFSLVPEPLHLEEGFTLRIPLTGCVDTRQLVPVTAVCQYWRDVAIGTPSLWSTLYDKQIPVYPISSGPLDSAVEPMHVHYLHRCEEGPLHIFIEHKISDLTSKVINENSTRVQAIHIDSTGGIPAENPQKLTSILSTPFPNVRSASISNLRVQASVLDLFSGQCLRLQELRLRNVRFLPSQSLPTLTHVSITPPSSSGVDTLQNVLTFLSGSPQLRELQLVNFAFRRVPLTLDGWHGQSVRLDRLQLLDISEPPRWGHRRRNQDLDPFLSEFLPYIAIPETCTIKLGKLGGSELEYVASVIAAQRPMRPPTRLLLCGVRETKGVSICSIVTADPEISQYTCIKIPIGHRTERWSRFTQVLPWSGVADTLASVSTFTAIRELYLHAGAGTAWFSDVDSIFPYLSRLELLIMKVERPATLWSILAELDHDPDYPTEINCPSLAMLSVTCRSWSERGFLLNLAEARSSAGYPLSRLFIDYSRKSFKEMAEYDADGELVRIVTEGEAQQYRYGPVVEKMEPKLSGWADGKTRIEGLV